MNIPSTKEVLQHLNWKQDQFAKICGIGQSSVSYRVTHNKPVTESQALLLASATDLSLDFLRPDLVKKLSKLKEEGCNGL